MGSEFEPQGLICDDEIKSMSIEEDIRNRCYRARLEAKGVTVETSVGDLRIKDAVPYQGVRGLILELEHELKKQVEIATWPV